MKIKSYSPAETSNVPGIPEDAKQWVGAVLESRDVHLKDITRCLTSRLDFSNNSNAEVRDVQLFHGVEAEIKLQTLKSRPIGVLHLYNEDHDYAKVKWIQSDQDRIKVTVSFDAAPSDDVLTRLLILGE
jgi:hypothetical protein